MDFVRLYLTSGHCSSVEIIFVLFTGMIAPTSGTAKINGYSIVTETELARKSLGLCPQHNVLFPDLTVAEHIIFYCRLKCVSKTQIETEVNHYLKLLKLEEKVPYENNPN